MNRQLFNIQQDEVQYAFSEFNINYNQYLEAYNKISGSTYEVGKVAISPPRIDLTICQAFW